MNDLAARADGGQLPVGVGADQDKHRAWRRFLQCLQETVGRFFIEIIGVIDDGHLASAARRLQTQALTKLAHDVDGKLELILRLDGDKEIGVCAGGDLQARRALIAGLEPAGRRTFA